MKETNNFKEIGNYLINTGIYLTTKTEAEFDLNSQLHQNIVNMLMQSYVYLTEYSKLREVTNKIECKPEPETEKFLTRREVISIYHPLLTEYGLTQAINTKELQVIKRGKKFFFNKTEIDRWIKEKEDKSLLKSFKLV